jgi:hypothetical protein
MSLLFEASKTGNPDAHAPKKGLAFPPLSKARDTLLAFWWCLVPEGTTLHLPTATSIMYAWRRFWKSKPGGEGIEDRLERQEAITREKRINKP